MQIGTHEVDFEPPDLITIRVKGDVLEGDADLLCTFCERCCEGLVRNFVIADLTQLGVFPSGVRKRLALRMRELPNEGTVVIGASFTARILMQCLIQAMQLAMRRQATTVFVDDEAAARTWIAKRRAHFAVQEAKVLEAKG
ncbi:hypothetical protein [Chondromyces crocatus]|uniref:STAS/SEC14 domain-containing protein n=1 Tax=Chondromyces crocatus TaxID=52 RepID=A0A0K1EHT7_CHOCO|nr:hypothetical protein [Chondromyces crocatus]AKT40247.1 uncharacterized protein CMC5_044000 [Chondromyces crocatus]